MQKSSDVVWLADSAYDSMITEADSAYPNETGGVLLGYWSDAFAEAVITRSIGPGPQAVHRSVDFVPDDEYQLREIEFHYRNSGRLHTYLGDWHTHPKGNSYVSGTDRRTLKKIAFFPDARAPIPLMMILSNGPHWSKKVWRYRPPPLKGLHFLYREAEMNIRTFSDDFDWIHDH